MEYPKIHEWELAVDASEVSSLGDLPAAPEPGQLYEGAGSDGIIRRWVAVRIAYGNPAARWAYWLPWSDGHVLRAGIGPNPNHLAIADKLFNGDAHNFIGMLAVPYVKSQFPDQTVWVLTDPKPSGPRVEYVVEPPLPSRHDRYERSKEVFDVETGESRTI